MRKALRILAVLVVALAASIAVPAYAANTPVAVIDLNAPVTSGTQCMPCHATIGASTTPGLIFQHGSHMMVSCDTCHWAPAHSGLGTVKPSMQACFNCHGLKHGTVEIASSACTTCHTKPRSQLVPGDHAAPNYAGAGHVAPSNADTNQCLMCHTGAWCDECHVREKVSGPATQASYKPLLPNRPRRPAIKVEPTGPVTMGQCVACHPDLDNYIKGRVIFAHATHLSKAFACKDCHRAFPHTADGTTRPDMPACYQCHGLQHAKLGLVATDKCADCHPSSFALRPSDHTAAFVSGGHKTAADGSLSTCAMCHASQFCIDCHQGRPKKAGGPARKQVMPADHKLGSFKLKHGQDFLAQKGACGTCHDSPSCERCHVTPMPHPADWTSTHGLATDLNAADCKVCHTDRSSCEECHHRGLRGAALTLANCVKCHPVMKTQPATAIKDAGIAEHAVHFIVAQKKGAPYRCEQCHVGFGYTAVQAAGTGGAVNQAHDLTTCYSCHGALNYENVLIAPYPGYQLCLRCHSNLNL